MRVNPNPRHWLPKVESGYVYHVTLEANLESIAEKGLIPRKATSGEDYAAVFVFPNREDMETALEHWLMEKLMGDFDDLGLEGETVDVVVLGILLEGINEDKCVSDVGYEIAVKHTIRPKYIRVLETYSEPYAT